MVDIKEILEAVEGNKETVAKKDSKLESPKSSYAEEVATKEFSRGGRE